MSPPKWKLRMEGCVSKRRTKAEWRRAAVLRRNSALPATHWVRVCGEQHPCAWHRGLGCLKTYVPSPLGAQLYLSRGQARREEMIITATMWEGVPSSVSIG